MNCVPERFCTRVAPPVDEPVFTTAYVLALVNTALPVSVIVGAILPVNEPATTWNVEPKATPVFVYPGPTGADTAGPLITGAAVRLPFTVSPLGNEYVCVPPKVAAGPLVGFILLASMPEPPCRFKRSIAFPAVTMFSILPLRLRFVMVSNG